MASGSHLPALALTARGRAVTEQVLSSFRSLRHLCPWTGSIGPAGLPEYQGGAFVLHVDRSSVVPHVFPCAARVGAMDTDCVDP